MARKSTTAATAASVIIGGSAAFLAAAFMPVARVFAEPDPRVKLTILSASPRQWKFEQQLFAAGTAVMPIGVAMLARSWGEGNQQAGQQRSVEQRFARGAAVAMAAGAVPFLALLEARYRNPEGFASGGLPSWPFYSYTWLNLTGMAALGTALLTRPRKSIADGAAPADPQWPGWLNAGGAAVFGGALAATGDLPPLLVYGVELVTGISVRRRERATATRAPA